VRIIPRGLDCLALLSIRFAIYYYLGLVAPFMKLNN
jgi:hypothetical protein